MLVRLPPPGEDDELVFRSWNDWLSWPNEVEPGWAVGLVRVERGGGGAGREGSSPDCDEYDSISFNQYRHRTRSDQTRGLVKAHVACPARPAPAPGPGPARPKRATPIARTRSATQACPAPAVTRRFPCGEAGSTPFGSPEATQLVGAMSLCVNAELPSDVRDASRRIRRFGSSAV